jgi:hypothetical protein
MTFTVEAQKPHNSHMRGMIQQCLAADFRSQEIGIR